MSVLIKGMEMPKSCAKCKLFGEYGCPFIGAVGYALIRGERNEDCPLVPVPKHGRLIDVEAPLRFEVAIDAKKHNTIVNIYAPTFIEAEEGET